jgi:hypothetical protein
MKKADLACLTGSVFIALTALFYCSTIWFSIAVPRYYPLEHTWKCVNEKGVISQGWYGMQGFAFLAAGIVTSLVYLALKRFCPPNTALTPAATRWISVVTLFIVLPCMGYLLYHEFVRWKVF